MSSRAKRRVSLSCVAGALLGYEVSARANDAQPIRLEYRAPSSCPDEAALFSRIRARVEVRRASATEPVPTFGITLADEGQRIIGRIASMSERREPTSREVSGTDCSDVVDAVALIVSMAISPSAAVRDGVSAQAPEDPMRDTGQATKTNEPVAAIDERPRLRLLGSAQGEATFGYVPTALLGAGVRLQLFRTSEYLGGPAVALGFVATESTERSLPQGQATLSFNVGELFLCPTSFAVLASVHVLPCGRVDIGQVRAEGTGIPNPRNEKLLWSSVGALGQIAIVPVKPLVIDAQASILFPLTPYEFIFEPNSVIYEAPRVGFSGSIAVGLMFL